MEKSNRGNNEESDHRIGAHEHFLRLREYLTCAMSIKRIITTEEAGSRLKRKTAYFLSYAAAIRHYRNEGYDYAATDFVLKKLRNNEISIGMPPLGKGQQCCLIDGGTRWAIVEPHEKREKQ